MKETSHITLAAESNAALQDLSANVIYLMGFSFVLGSLFTILLLIILDVMRQRSATRQHHA